MERPDLEALCRLRPDDGLLGSKRTCLVSRLPVTWVPEPTCPENRQTVRPAPSEVAAIYSCRSPITTFVSVEAFTFFSLRIARIVSRSSPVSLVVFGNPRADLCYQAFVCRSASA